MRSTGAYRVFAVVSGGTIAVAMLLAALVRSPDGGYPLLWLIYPSGVLMCALAVWTILELGTMRSGELGNARGISGGDR